MVESCYVEQFVSLTWIVDRNIGIEVVARIPRKCHLLCAATTAFHAELPLPAIHQSVETMVAGLAVSTCRILVNHLSF